jgi:hypothetical protein
MPPIRRCKHCKRTRAGLTSARKQVEYLHAHEALCLGIDEGGDYLDIPWACIICGVELVPTTDLVEKSVQHYKTVHQIAYVAAR